MTECLMLENFHGIGVRCLVSNSDLQRSCDFLAQHHRAPFTLVELKLRYYFATMGSLLAHATRSGFGLSEKVKKQDWGEWGQLEDGC
jgi:hypothetical protein